MSETQHKIGTQERGGHAFRGHDDAIYGQLRWGHKKARFVRPGFFLTVAVVDENKDQDTDENCYDLEHY